MSAIVPRLSLVLFGFIEPTAASLPQEAVRIPATSLNGTSRLRVCERWDTAVGHKKSKRPPLQEKVVLGGQFHPLQSSGECLIGLEARNQVVGEVADEFSWIKHPSRGSGVCVCVCHSLFRRALSFPILDSGRGHRPIVDTCANEAVPRWGKRRLITSVYLLNFLQAVTPLFHGLIPWSLHDRPQNLFPPQTCSRLAITLTVRVQTLFNHTVLADLFAMPFPHLPSQRGN